MSKITVSSIPKNLLKKCYSTQNSVDKDLDKEFGSKPEHNYKEVIVPPDGGWGWVVAIAAFMCNMTVDGNVFCFGVFLPHIAKSFDVPESRISVIGSLMQGTFLLVGPFTGIIVNTYGLRVATIAGALLSATGYLSSYFVYSLPLMYLTHGVLIGIGFGFMYMTSLIAVGFYFEKWRALATGIGVAGSGVGTVVFAPLQHYLIEKYGWRNVLLLQSTLASLGVLYGACFRPLKPQKRFETTPSKLDESQPLNPNGDENVSSNPAFNNSKNLDGVPPPCMQRYSYYDRRTSAPDVWNACKEHPGIFFSSEDLMDKKLLALNKANKKTNNEDVIIRPLSRRDIFFSGNLTKLPESCMTSRSSLSTEEGSQGNGCCKGKIHKSSFIMLHLGLLKSPTFILYSLHGMCMMLGFLTPYLFIGARARSKGMREDLAVWLVSSIGITNTCGKILSGLLVSATGVQSVTVSAIASLLGGIFLVSVGLSTSDAYQFVVAIVFGLSVACFTSLKSVALVELLGLDKLTNAFGLFLLFLGIGSLVGPPLTAVIMEMADDYDVSFYVSGSCFLASALILCCLKFVNKWERNRSQSEVLAHV